jgi:carbamoyl-phosphate synthase small subunit
VQAAGLIVRESEDLPSNWRSQGTVDGFLKQHEKPGLQGVDTRAITKHLRSAGVAMGLLPDGDPAVAIEKLNKLPEYGERNFVEEVSTRGPYAWGFEGREPIDAPASDYRCKLAVLDLGLKYNILRRFAALKCRSIVLPQTSTAEEILGWAPDGLVISPGPGDPKNLSHAIEVVNGLLGKLPIFGICLGNQMLAHAMGGKTYKLKFGHRGSNHPVKDLVTGHVTITSQNHGYAVDSNSLTGTGAEIDLRCTNRSKYGTTYGPTRANNGLPAIGWMTCRAIHARTPPSVAGAAAPRGARRPARSGARCPSAARQRSASSMLVRAERRSSARAASVAESSVGTIDTITSAASRVSG